jgi:hypothetical protein
MLRNAPPDNKIDVRSRPNAANDRRSAPVRRTWRRGILEDACRPNSERLTTAGENGLQMSDM